MAEKISYATTLTEDEDAAMREACRRMGFSAARGRKYMMLSLVREYLRRTEPEAAA